MDVLWDKQPAPPVGLGSGRGSLGDKFHASVMQGFLIGGGLDADSHAPALSAFTSEVVVATGDMGVEFGLPSVLPMDVKKLFPWLDVPAPVVPQTEEDDDDWSFNPQIQSVPAPVSFTRALQVPGLQHVVHNAASDMLNCAPTIKAETAKLAAVAKMVRRKHSRKRLVNMCFSGPVGKLMAAEVKFRGELYDKRWRSIAACAEDVLRCQKALAWGWDKDKFRDKEKTDSVAALAVDSAITDQGFWYAMEALSHLQFVVQEILDWSRGCPCHSAFLIADVPKDAKRRWRACPLRSMRLPELAAGDLLTHIKDIMRLQSVGLALRAPPSLDSRRRDYIIAEYMRSQGNLLCILALKLGPLQLEQYMLAAIAHHDEHVSRAALERCMTCECKHALMAEFHSGELRLEAESYLQGWQSWEELVKLPEFVSAFKFASVDETSVESYHARVERLCGGATDRSTAYD